ncbi:MAG: hypothetical protein ACOYMG_21000 [Candidatus Methylumidiphilus sp.]
MLLIVESLIAVMNRWTCFAVLFAALVFGPLDCLASESPKPLNVEAMCFEHIGPQDKPMPAFCVSAFGVAHSIMGILRAADVPPIQLTSETWRALLDLIEKEGSKDVGHPTVPGQYQLRLIPLGGILYLPPEAMRKITLALIKINGLNDAQSQMLQRLKLRIAG